MSQVSQYIGARARFQDKRRSRSTPPAPARGPQKRSWWWLTRVWRPIKEHTRVMTPPRTPSLPADIPDICHERHEYICVNFFWPV